MLSSKAVSRLTKLAEVARNFPRKHFSMRASFHSSDELAPGTVITAKHIKGDAIACALGIAGTVPAFRKKGFRVLMWPRMYRGFASYRGNGGTFDTEFVAAASFFDISLDQAHHLFNAGRVHVSTPKQWAAHCSRFLKTGGAHAS